MTDTTPTFNQNSAMDPGAGLLQIFSGLSGNDAQQVIWNNPWAAYSTIHYCRDNRCRGHRIVVFRGPPR